MIKVLIVDDSRTVNQYLDFILSDDPDIEVIGNVFDGQQAIDFIEKSKPDIISMDIDMPKMNGLEATRRIMTTTPIPIIVVTASRNADKENISIEALAAGALTLIHKPVGIGHPNEEIKIKKLVSLIKVYSQVKVIKRKPKSIKKLIPDVSISPKMDFKTPPVSKLLNKRYVAIGISSGGPQVLEKIFSKISDNFPYPIFVVQHITKGFLENMVAWLNRLLSIPVHVATDKEIPRPGHIYFAPDKFQMGINLNKVELRSCSNETRICPSAAYLFNNLATHYGRKTIAMMLTGMGSDGAQEMKLLRDKGAITIAQDEESSLVHGMPGEAIKLGGAEYILNPDKLAQLLLDIENYSKKNKRTY